MNPVIGRHLRLRGRVQGVGFRWWTRDLAERSGVRGSVRNLADGRVEVRAWGSLDQMTPFLEGLLMGPALARVEAVAELPISEPPPPGGFVILP